MSEDTVYLLECFLAIAWNAFVIIGAVYLINVYDWSKWTMLLALVLCSGVKRDKLKGKYETET